MKKYIFLVIPLCVSTYSFCLNTLDRPNRHFISIKMGLGISDRTFKLPSTELSDRLDHDKARNRFAQGVQLAYQYRVFHGLTD